MSTLSLRLPESLHAKVRELASAEGVSINQFLTLAAAEKVSALLTVDYLRARAARGSQEAFDAVLARVPDVEPDPSDRIE
jgi:hypothetical protein